jgi:hypothetical protein
MRIPLTDRVTSAAGRIFFFSVCFGDWRTFKRRLFPAFARYAADAGVRALCVQGCAEHTQCNRDRRQNFQRFHFHKFVLRNISQPRTQTDAQRGQFKKDLNNCAVIRPAFSGLLNRYSFSKTRNLSSSIRRSKAR